MAGCAGLGANLVRHQSALHRMQEAVGILCRPAATSFLRGAGGANSGAPAHGHDDHGCYLALCDTQVDDDGLQSLEGLTHLKQLILSGTPITGHGLRSLEHLVELEYLILLRVRNADEHLKYLANLTALRVLELEYTDISDAGLRHLARLTRMEMLNLTGTRMTGSGLVHLRGMQQLWSLIPSDAPVEDAG